jgi:hypothetical protein
MVAYAQTVVQKFLAECQDASLSTTARGRAFEQLFAHFLEPVPSVVFQRDTVNFAQSDEIDIAVAHNPWQSGLGCYPSLFLVEAKNWDADVDSPSISVFTEKLRARCIELGILFTTRGVTGEPASRRAAHEQAASALRDGIRLVLITVDDVLRLRTSEEFTLLLVKRVLGLAASGSFVLNWI